MYPTVHSKFDSGMNDSLKGKYVLELDVDKNAKEECSYSEIYIC